MSRVGVHYKQSRLNCRLFRGTPLFSPKNKRSIITIDGSDGLCCAKAIAVGLKRLEDPLFKPWRNRREVLQRAKALHLEAQVPEGHCGKVELDKFQKTLALLNVQLHVVYYEMGNMIGFRGDRKLFTGYTPQHVYLYYRNAHYDLITSMTGFTCRHYYCCDCDIAYSHLTGHKCTAECPHCKVPLIKCPPKILADDEWIECEARLVLFKNESCFANHVEKRLNVAKRRRRKVEDEEEKEYEEDEEEEDEEEDEEEEEEEEEEDEEDVETQGRSYSVCRRFKRCPKCLKIVDLKIKKSRRNRIWREMREHVCGDFFCRCCATLVGEGHRCFIQRISLPKKDPLTKPFLFLFFDFEANPVDVRGHVGDLVKAMHVCNVCQTHAWTTRCEKYGQRMLTFYSLKDFMNYLIAPDNVGCIAMAHNVRHYDGLFMLRWAIENGHVPKVIMNGGKLMSLRFPRLKIQVKDSLNFIPRALRHLPKMFDLEETKGYFPHRFNTIAHINYVGPYPNAEFYGADFMSVGERPVFLEWHADKVNSFDPLKIETWFDLEKEKNEYCEMDVMVLAKVMMKFREICIREDRIDPIVEVLTLPSFCLKSYRMNHMPPDSIGVLPEGGYRPVQNQSTVACQWLWMMKETGMITNWSDFRSVLHPEGEVTLLGKFRVDGFDPVSNTVYEFHGCIFHGCPTCFPRRRTRNPISHQTMEQLFSTTCSKTLHLRDAGYHVVEMWEHAFKSLLQTSKCPECPEWILNRAPLNARDAMRGGRCGPFSLWRKTEGEEKIRYVDFNSLYPSCQLERYPIGHPTVLTADFADKPEKVYFGLMKAKVVGNGKLHAGVLPVRVRGKLMFPLCKTCAEEQSSVECEHSEKHRAMVGTWTTLELKLAVEKGYTILQVYEVWHYSESSTLLFSSYILAKMKDKQEASGWPPGVETDDEKTEYIDAYYQRTGILLDRSKIERNEARRGQAKLMLNTLWGKFGEKTKRTTTVFVDDPAKFWNLITDNGIEVTRFHMVHDDLVCVSYVKVDEFILEGPRQSIVVAAWTTSLARVKLYKELDKLLPEQRLYTDTDSVLYVDRPGWPSLETGEALGQLASEIEEGDHIVEFVCAGPKAYAYRTRGGTVECKVKGIHMNFTTSKRVHLEAMLELVQDEDEEQEGALAITVPDPQIVRDVRTYNLRTDEAREKTFVLHFDKRMRRQYDSLPFGATKN